MKKGFLLSMLPLMAVFCLFSTIFAQPRLASAATVSASFELEATEFAKPGDTVELKVSVDLSGSVSSAFNFDIKYDSTRLEYASYTANYKASNTDSNIMKLSNGTLRALFAGDPLESSSCVPVGKTLLYTISFTVKQNITDATAEFSMSDIVVNYMNGNKLTEISQSNITSGNASVNIQNVLSNDNTLKALTVDKGTLSPSFSSAVTSYTVTVPYETDKITISAVKNHEQATFSGDGMKSLSLGENTFTITVTAQDGSTKAYTVKVTREQCKDNKLKSLAVNTGTLSPSFNAETTSYTMTVPYTTTKITLTATSAHETATVSGAGEKQLSVGANTITIVVTAQNGDTKTYTVVVTREAASTDNTLKSLTVSTGTLSPSFSAATTSYTVTVPYTTTNITVGATKNHIAATVSGAGEKTLSVGANTITIVVTAQNGDTKTYTVVVTREAASTDNNLKSLTVSTGTLSPSFNAATTSYTVTVPYSVTKITVGATKNHTAATVTGTGEKTLSVGTNTITIVVTAQSGAAKTYTITVTREKCTDNTLKALSVNGYALVPSFSASVTEYTINVPYTASSIIISATKNHETASVSGTGTKSLSVSGGDEFSVTVTAQNGVEKVYKIKVVKAAPSTDNKLKSLTVSTGTLSPSFSAATTAYTVNVPYTTTKISIAATQNDVTATVSGTGEKTLSVGANTIIIVVTAQNGDTRTYTVVVTREAASTDNKLKSLTVSTGTLSPSFNAATTSYTVTVPYSVTKITVGATKNHTAATVTGTGEKTLSVGANTITIVVTAQSGAAKTYTVTVTREKSTDNTLKSLTLSTGQLTPSFNSGVTEYIVLVPYTTSSIKINYALNSSVASAAPSGGTINGTLKVGVNEFNITVTAQNGEKKTYKISVSRAEPSEDNTLKSLTVNTGTLSPSFSASTTDYTVTVPYTTTKITLAATKNHTAAIVTGTGEKILLVGTNKIEITVTAQSGAKKIYTVNVTREAASTDNKLKQLSVNGYSFAEEFSPLRYQYTLTVPYSVSELTVEAVKNHSAATVAVSGNKALSVGANIITVTVTAQDDSKQVYTINVERRPASSNSQLKSLIPSEGELDEIFNANTTVYDMTVGYKTETLSFEWETADAYAEAYITAVDNLEAGMVNVFTITVTAEDGSITYYIINVMRALQSSDTTLSSLAVGGTRFDFKPDVREYDIGVPFGITRADIKFTTSSKYASAVLDGDVELSADKINEFTITVTAEDGSTGVYNLRISYRAIESDTSLKSLVDSEGILSFASDVSNYSIRVPYSVSSITFEYVLGGKYSSAVLSGPSTLTAGSENVYTLIVTAEDSSTAVYTITVFRMTASTNAALSSLEAEGFKLSPEFDPEVIAYRVYIPYSVEAISLIYTTAHEYATVEFTAPESLEAGVDNIFKIKVISESGMETMEYTVIVYRDVISEDSSLSELEVKGGSLEPEFSPLEISYTARVPYITQKAEFIYRTGHMGAVAEVLGPDSLEVGDNIYTITVTAENGSETVYTINVIRSEKDNDSTLSKLVPSSGSLEFSPDVLEYELTVGYNISEITFEYEANSRFASTAFDGDTALEAGVTNTFVIRVIAEDGSVTEYKIKVTRILLSSDSSASSICVMDNYLLIVPGKTEYSLSVAYDVTSASIEVLANDSKASVEIMRSGEQLSVGENVIRAIITAEDGSFTEYKIKITRDAGSSNAYLEFFGAENGSFNEEFDPNRLSYTMTVKQEVKKLVPLVRTAHEKAVFEVSNTELKFGENLITVTVTSENGNVMQYKLRVTREKTSMWTMLTQEVMFSVGGLGITVFMFIVAAVAVIMLCIVILIIIKRRSMKY